MSEILFNQGLTGYTGFDPTNPSQRLDHQRGRSEHKAPITHEFLVGLDKELAANFSISTTFTYRRMLDLLWDPLTGVNPSDYTQTGVLTGTAPRSALTACRSTR